MFVLFEEPMRRPPIHSFQLCAFLRPLVAYAGWCDEVRSSTPQHPTICLYSISAAASKLGTPRRRRLLRPQRSRAPRV